MQLHHHYVGFSLYCSVISQYNITFVLASQYVTCHTRDNLSGAPDGNFGNQDTSFFGSEAEKTSWDNGLPSFGRFVLCFSPFELTVQFSSSLLVTHNC